jgi:Fur family peroxide stress response transcriptional regulator
VYAALNTLVRLGLVYELGNAGDGQKHYDPVVAPHANLICVQCHRISDLNDRALETVSRRVAEQSGYQIQGARIVYYGVCPACAKRRAR